MWGGAVLDLVIIVQTAASCTKQPLPCLRESLRAVGAFYDKRVA